MGNKHLLHVRSKSIVGNKAKLPTANDIEYGEIAINYAKGCETISIKNSENEIVPLTFNNSGGESKNYITGITVNGDTNIYSADPITHIVDINVSTPEGGMQSFTIKGKEASTDKSYNATNNQVSLSGNQITFNSSSSITQAINAVSANTKAVSDNYISGATLNGSNVTVSDKKLTLNVSGSTIKYSSDKTINQAIDGVSGVVNTVNDKYISGITINGDDATVANHHATITIQTGGGGGEETHFGTATGFTINGVNSTTQASGKFTPSATISGNVINVGTPYESVTYPQSFIIGSADRISSTQKLNEALGKIEKQISILSTNFENAMIADGGIYNSTNKSIGYIPNVNSNYIKDASSQNDADTLLDSTLHNFDLRLQEIERLLMKGGIPTKWYDGSGNLLQESYVFGDLTSSYKVKDCVYYVLGDNVTSIGQDAFTNCQNLSSITISKDVTNINSLNPFYGTINVTKISVENGNPYFYDEGNCLMRNNKTLIVGCKNSKIPSDCVTIADYAFRSCSSLTSVTIPNSVTSIGGFSFSNCLGLTSVTIPNSVTSIGSAAFSSCSSLTSITIPNSVTSIGSTAFGGCSGLTSLTIGNNVTSIGNEAFQNCSSLTSLTIPDSITSIGNWAFQSCSSLTSATIGSGVTSIGNYVFTGCTSLTSVINKGKVLGYYEFSACSNLSSVTLTTNLNHIYTRPFYACSKLKNIYYNGTTSQWNNITKETDWDSTIKSNKCVIHCSNGDITLS